MNKAFIVGLIIIHFDLIAQNILPVSNNSVLTKPNTRINLRKSSLIEKQILDVAKFKNVIFQKIIFKDISDNSTESTLGISSRYESFDNVSQKTLTIEKLELEKLIKSLLILEQKERETSNHKTRYKFVTISNIEFGGIYDEEENNWKNYVKFPLNPYNQDLNIYSKDELKDLIKILQDIENEL